VERRQELSTDQAEISTISHPFFTGKERVRDSGGRIDRFKKKYGKK
jgi:large subunit ribosomal protein L31